MAAVVAVVAVVVAAAVVVVVVEVKRSWFCVFRTSNGCVITAAITAAVAPDKRLTVLSCVDVVCDVCGVADNVADDVADDVVDNVVDDGVVDDDDASAAVYIGLNASKLYQYKAE